MCRDPRYRSIFLLSISIASLALLMRLAAPAAGETVPAANDQSNRTAAFEVANIEVIGQIGGINMALDVAGDVAYVSRGGRLLILDISTPAAPVLVGKTSPVPTPIVGLAIHGDYAYLAAGESGMWVVDVADPEAPVVIGHWQATAPVSQVVVSDNHAYAIAGILFVVDISDQAAPHTVGQYVQGVRDIVINDGIAYLATEQGLDILSLDDPVHPQRLGLLGVDGLGEQIAVWDRYAYLTTVQYACGYFLCIFIYDMTVVDIADMALPVSVSHLTLPTPPHDMAVDETTLYMGTWNEINTVDVSDPTNPRPGDKISTPGCAWGVERSGQYLYIADCAAGMRIIDVSNPTEPLEAGFYDDMMFTPKDITIEDGRAYIPQGVDGLLILDIVSPTELEVVGSYTGPGSFRQLAVVDERA